MLKLKKSELYFNPFGYETCSNLNRVFLKSHSENKSGDFRKSEKYKDLKKNQSAIAPVGFAKVYLEKLGSFGIS